MIRIEQSDRSNNPYAAVFSLASQAYKSEDLIPQVILKHWWQQHPSLFYLAFEGETLCGYMSAFPVTREAFKKTLEPDFDEKKLEPTSIINFDAKGEYQMYFSSIVVHPSWRGQGVSNALREDFLNNLLLLWGQGSWVTQLSSIVIVVSPKVPL